MQDENFIVKDNQIYQKVDPDVAIPEVQAKLAALATRRGYAANNLDDIDKEIVPLQDQLDALNKIKNSLSQD